MSNFTLFVFVVLSFFLFIPFLYLDSVRYVSATSKTCISLRDSLRQISIHYLNITLTRYLRAECLIKSPRKVVLFEVNSRPICRVYFQRVNTILWDDVNKNWITLEIESYLGLMGKLKLQ